jgi:hypothetical protein
MTPQQGQTGEEATSRSREERSCGAVDDLHCPPAGEQVGTSRRSNNGHSVEDQFLFRSPDRIFACAPPDDCAARHRGLLRRVAALSTGVFGLGIGVLAIAPLVRNPWKHTGGGLAVAHRPVVRRAGETVYLRLDTGEPEQVVLLRPEDLDAGGYATPTTNNPSPRIRRHHRNPHSTATCPYPRTRPSGHHTGDATEPHTPGPPD